MIEIIIQGALVAVVLFPIASALAFVYASRNPERAVRFVADAFGVDLLDLGGGFEEATRRAHPNRILAAAIEENGNKNVAHRIIKDVPAGILLGEIQSAAERGEEFQVSDLVTSAGNVSEPSLMIETALLGEDVDRAEILGSHLSDDELGTLLGDRDLWPDPIQQVAVLDDDPDRCFAWILSDDANEEARASLAKEIEATFIESGGREPEALHLIVNEVGEISELDAETVKRYIKPWLKGRDKGKEASE